MKRLLFVCAVLFTLMVSPCFAIEYCKDFLESGNAGGWSGSLKTFEDEWMLMPGETVTVDIWLNDVSEDLITAGCYITYDPALVNIVNVIPYDNANGGPWEAGFTNNYEVIPGQWFLALGNFDCVSPDGDGDIILAKVTIECQVYGDIPITIQSVPRDFDEVVGCASGTVYDSQISPNRITIHQRCDADNDCDDGLYCNGTEWCDSFNVCQPGISSCPLVCEACDEEVNACVDDSKDCDGIQEGQDNCFIHHNPGQEDSYPPLKNVCGDACECEGNFDGNDNQDGSDAYTFKVDFGRNSYENPCTDINPCNGDFDCNGNVDGTDATLFKSDFGRNSYDNPCPNCVTIPWCEYDGPDLSECGVQVQNEYEPPFCIRTTYRVCIRNSGRGTDVTVKDNLLSEFQNCKIGFIDRDEEKEFVFVYHPCMDVGFSVSVTEPEDHSNCTNIDLD